MQDVEERKSEITKMYGLIKGVSGIAELAKGYNSSQDNTVSNIGSLLTNLAGQMMTAMDDIVKDDATLRTVQEEISKQAAGQNTNNNTTQARTTMPY